MMKERVDTQATVKGSYNQIEVSQVTVVLDDQGNEVARGTPHRHVVSPGDDVSAEAQVVQDIAAAVHTQAVIDAYNASQDR